MRFVLAAAMALVAAVPAQAATITSLDFRGFVSGDGATAPFVGTVTFRQPIPQNFTGTVTTERRDGSFSVPFADSTIADGSNGSFTLINGKLIDFQVSVLLDQKYSASVGNGGYSVDDIENGRSFSGGLYVSGVPEPATWAMMIAGFGFVGSAMRRRVRYGSTVYG